MDYKKQYKELQNYNGISPVPDKYKNADDFAKCILALRLAGYSYSDIQRHLGMPPKKLIRRVLLEWAPELIDNSVSKVIQYSTAYSELYNLLCKTNKTEWDIWGDTVECCIKNHRIYFDGDPLDDWSETEQYQILEEIKKQWN